MSFNEIPPSLEKKHPWIDHAKQKCTVVPGKGSVGLANEGHLYRDHMALSFRLRFRGVL